MGMTDALNCYGDDIRALADSAETFDASSPADSRRWYRAQWARVSRALHWNRALPALEGDIDAMETAALEAFGRWLRKRQGQEPVNEARAQVRSRVLSAIERAFLKTNNTWRTDIPSGLLPDSACYGDRAAPVSSDQAMMRAFRGRPLPGGPHRAFRADVAPSYFGPRHATRPKGCEYPVVLSLGTYPYVYGGVLGLEPPGLRWSAGASWRPAGIAMLIASRFWRPEWNLAQDARIVVLQFRHFQRTTAPFVQAVPTTASSRSQVRARLFRDGGRLRSTGALALTRVRAPRGDLSASAYNFCLDAFAAFFSARRAYLRSLHALPSAAARALATNPDTCMRDTTSELARQ